MLFLSYALFEFSKSSKLMNIFINLDKYWVLKSAKWLYGLYIIVYVSVYVAEVKNECQVPLWHFNLLRERIKTIFKIFCMFIALTLSSAESCMI